MIGSAVIAGILWIHHPSPTVETRHVWALVGAVPVLEGEKASGGVVYRRCVVKVWSNGRAHRCRLDWRRQRLSGD